MNDRLCYFGCGQDGEFETIRRIPENKPWQAESWFPARLCNKHVASLKSGKPRQRAGTQDWWQMQLRGNQQISAHKRFGEPTPEHGYRKDRDLRFGGGDGRP